MSDEWWEVWGCREGVHQLGPLYVSEEVAQLAIKYHWSERYHSFWIRRVA